MAHGGKGRPTPAVCEPGGDEEEPIEYSKHAKKHGRDKDDDAPEVGQQQLQRDNVSSPNAYQGYEEEAKSNYGQAHPIDPASYKGRVVNQ